MFKLDSSRPINKDKFEEIMTGIWKLKDKASFHKVEKDILLVNFHSQMDQTKVIEGGPWTIDNCVVLMQKWEPSMIGEDFCNTGINIWVHLHRLPFELRNQLFAKELAAIAGKVTETVMSNNDNQFGGEFVKFHIELNTTKEIIPGFFFFKGKEENRPGFTLNMLSFHLSVFNAES